MNRLTGIVFSLVVGVAGCGVAAMAESSASSVLKIVPESVSVSAAERRQIESQMVRPGESFSPRGGPFVVLQPTYVGFFGTEYEPMIPAIESNMRVAFERWTSLMSGSGVITVRVELDPNGTRAGSTSLAKQYLGDRFGFHTYMEGWPFKQQTSIDPNGTDADIWIVFEPVYMTTQVWFDPTPELRTEPVPTDRTDGVSLFLRLFAYAVAGNGWLTPNTGIPIGPWKSLYDHQVTPIDGLWYFTGPHAQLLYGGPVPLATTDIYLLGNVDGAGAELVDGMLGHRRLVNGVRYEIDAMALAVAADCDVIIQPNCRADVNFSQSVTVQDIFDFLGVWFQGTTLGDFNSNSLVSVQDIFDFMASWFAGCN